MWNNIGRVILINILFCLPFFFAFAEEFDSSTNIYFCTRDVEEYESIGIPSEKSVDSDIKKIKVGKNDSTKHKPLRHCFVLLAEEIIDLDIDIYDNELMLQIGTGFSQGYYPDRNERGHVISEDEWLFNNEKRDERTVSCTSIMKEGDSKKSCSDDLVDKSYIYSAWYTLLSKMTEDVAKNPYFDKFNHNCCSVAFESLRKVNEEGDYLFDLSNINKRSYNILGRGISFSNADDRVVDYVVGSGRLFKDVSRSVKRIVVIKILSDDSIDEENEKSDDLNEL